MIFGNCPIIICKMMKEDAARKSNILAGIKEMMKGKRRDVKDPRSLYAGLSFANEADNQKAALFFDDLVRRITLPPEEKH